MIAFCRLAGFIISATGRALIQRHNQCWRHGSPQSELSPREVGELLGTLVDASSPAALASWQQSLDFEYRQILDLPAAPETSPIVADILADRLRANVTMLLSQVVRLRAVRRSLSVMRTVCCALGLALAALYFVSGMLIAGAFKIDVKNISDVLPVCLLGGLGGLVSGLSRLYTLEWRGLPLLTYTHVFSLGIGLLLNLLLASFEGIVFAVVLYAFFTGHLLEGTLFPATTWTAHDGSWATYITSGGPSSPVDTGKALVWAFAAGFSERLVPDLMRQLAAQGKLPATNTKA